MGYFGKQLGQRPQAATDAKPQFEAQAVELRSAIAGSGPGPHPDAGTRASSPSGDEARPTAGQYCPLCRALLLVDHGRWQCAEGCGATWVRVGSQLVDLAGLPYGVCNCCERPSALVRSPAGALCPASGLEYLLLASGPRLLRDAAPFGLCLCCQPPAPLGADQQGLFCLTQPYMRYQRNGSHHTVAAPAVSSAKILDAIDAALHKNTAHVTVHGLFDVE